MEALTGATVAALTVYDMCKALSHDIEITGVRLLAKSAENTLQPRFDPAGLPAVKSPHGSSLYGLVLAGGQSTRMRRDKATLTYQAEISSPRHGIAQFLRRAGLCVGARRSARRCGARALPAGGRCT